MAISESFLTGMLELSKIRIHHDSLDDALRYITSLAERALAPRGDDEALDGERAHARDEETVLLSEIFAGHVEALMANIEAYRSAVALADNLQQAMDSRAVIEQAKGMIMMERRCDAEAAFRTLVAASQTRNRKLREIAEEIVAGATKEP